MATACKISVLACRYKLKYITNFYLPSGLFVAVSWASFLIPPEQVAGRMAMLITLFLVLINIFLGMTARTPNSEGVSAMSAYIIACIFFVFGALCAYAYLLWKLKPTVLFKVKMNDVIESAVASLIDFCPLQKHRRQSSQFPPPRATKVNHHHHSGEEEREDEQDTKVKPELNNSLRRPSPLKGDGRVGGDQQQHQDDHPHFARGGENSVYHRWGKRLHKSTGQIQQNYLFFYRIFVDDVCIIVFPFAFALFNVMYWCGFTFSFPF